MSRENLKIKENKENVLEKKFSETFINENYIPIKNAFIINLK